MVLPKSEGQLCIYPFNFDAHRIICIQLNCNPPRILNCRQVEVVSFGCGWDAAMAFGEPSLGEAKVGAERSSDSQSFAKRASQFGLPNASGS